MRFSTALLLTMLLALCVIPAMAQSPPDTTSNEIFGFGGVRYDNGAVLVSVGALYDKVELLPIPGLLDVDIGPLSCIWYTDVFSTLWADSPEKTSGLAFELAVKTQLLTPRLTGGLTLGAGFEQQETPETAADYIAAATGAFAGYNWAKASAVKWGPWAYAKYKTGLDDDFKDGWQAGVGFFYQLE